MFGNPVNGHIYGKGETHPAGAFWVTATWQDHVNPPDGSAPRPGGVDIGNGRCGDPLYAMCDGVVSLSGLVGYPVANALTVRIRDGKGYEPATTHMSTTAVKAGQIVKRGQLIGTLGMSGATACHCHMGLKKLVNGAWVEVDIWPYLDQNEEPDMVPIPGASFQGLVNKKTTIINPAGANFRADRLTTSPVLALFPAGTEFIPVVASNDGSAAGGAAPTLWYGGFLYVASRGAMFGWLHSSMVGPLVDNLPPAGYTDADLNKAKKLGADVVSAAAVSAASKF